MDTAQERAAAVLAEIQRYFAGEGPTPGLVKIEGGRTLDAKSLVVVFRYQKYPTLLGVYLNVDELAMSNPDQTDVVSALEEILEPSKAYFLPSVNWAEGLVGDPTSVQWRGVDPAQFPDSQAAPDRATRMVPKTWVMGWSDE